MQVSGYRIIELSSDNDINMESIIPQFDLFYNIMFILQGEASVISDKFTANLTKGYFSIFEPFTFKKITPRDRVSIFIISFFLQKNEMRVVTGKSGNVIFESFSPDWWGLNHTTMELGSEFVFKKRISDTAPYQAVKLVFDNQDSSSIQKMSFSFFSGLTGMVYAFPIFERDFSIANAKAAKKITTAVAANKIRLTPTDFADENGVINGLILLFEPRTGGQIFVGKLDMLFNDNHEYSLKTSRHTEDDRFISLFKEISFANFESNELLKDVVKKAITFYSDFDEKGKVLLMNSVLAEFLYIIEKNKSELMKPDMLGSHYQKKVFEIIQYINDNIYSKLTLNDISEHFNLNKNYVSNIFKQNTGIPIITYIRNKQLSVARQMISSGTAPTEVFYQLGFIDYSNFYRAYKKQFGHSPKETPLFSSLSQ